MRGRGTGPQGRAEGLVYHYTAGYKRVMGLCHFRVALGLFAVALGMAGCGDVDVPAEPATMPPDPGPETNPCKQKVLGPRELELPAWNLSVSKARWDKMHEDVFADVDVDADLCIDGQAYPIELELQGSSTRDRPKKSFDLKFKHGRRPVAPPFMDSSTDTEDGAYRRLLLKAMYEDESLIREAVAFDLWREMGHEAPRVGFVNLRVNGEYWGLYELVEPVDEAYLKRHGYGEGGTLYKGVRKYGGFADFAPGRDLHLAFENRTDDDDRGVDGHEDEGDDGEGHEDDGEGPGKEEEEEGAWTDLENLVNRLQHTPLTQRAFEEDIDPIFPLAEFYDRIAWIAFTQNTDAVAQNFYLYNLPKDGHDFWSLIPWDSNMCLSAHWASSTRVLPPDAYTLLDGGNYFGKRLFKVDELREAYFARMDEVLTDVLPGDVVADILHGYADAVAHDLAVDQARWQRQVSPAEAVAIIETFLAERPAALRAAMVQATTDAGSEP